MSCFLTALKADRPNYKGDAIAEYLDFYRMGVDGVFTDFADVAVEARRRFLAEKA